MATVPTGSLGGYTGPKRPGMSAFAYRDAALGASSEVRVIQPEELSPEELERYRTATPTREDKRFKPLRDPMMRLGRLKAMNEHGVVVDKLAKTEPANNTVAAATETQTETAPQVSAKTFTPRDPTREELSALMAEGLKYAEIETRFGLPPGRVGYLRQKYSLPKRQPNNPGPFVRRRSLAARMESAAALTESAPVQPQEPEPQLQPEPTWPAHLEAASAVGAKVAAAAKPTPSYRLTSTGTERPANRVSLAIEKVGGRDALHPYAQMAAILISELPEGDRYHLSLTIEREGE